MELLFLIVGFALHEIFHIFLAIGGFALIKKIWGKCTCKKHNCSINDKN